ncbi:hypothetical protein GXW77_17395 [Roseomonas alkaliterrae]|jgi:hypothetical protein|uniref:head-tail joining protein n=1 Tax=Neoroseomonas alkaliterrae TaxID=1452450 RepID=UPI001BA4D572|nr:hypothetical protein [Neoroseomonas alkaliterrae]MBR0677952.1 hypothetical protein [Neoroseomonas alkaliterrae]
MVDFDRLVNAAVARSFARPVEFRRGAQPPIQARGVFHRQHLALAMPDGAEVSAMQASLSVRLSDLPPGYVPQQGDEVTIGADRWLVQDPQPDAEGMMRLVLSAYQEWPGP